MRASLHRLTGATGTAWLLCGLFLVGVGLVLPTLEYNFDEGVYIQQALLILHGNLPYRDFFCHQTPLYPLTLAAFGAPMPDSLFVFRLLSLLATALSGVFVYRIATHLMPRRAALVAPLLFYAAPLQFYGLLAIPQAMMQVCCIAGIYFIYFSRRRALWMLGAVLLVASLLYKPLSLSAAVALGLSVVVLRQHRQKTVWVGVAGVVVGALVWLSLDGMSDGRFTRLIQFQSERFAQKAGFEAAMQIAEFRQIANRGDITSPIEWNLNEHQRTFFRLALLNGNTWLLALAVGGQRFLSAGAMWWAGPRLLITLWWAVPLFFSIFLWEPIWDHYCIVYLPPLAILGALCAHRLWAAPQLGRRALAIVGVVGAVFLGTSYLMMRRSSYAEAMRGPQAGETWLTFDPFVNFVTRTYPACGIVDPLNVYGDNSFGSTSHAQEFARFFVRPADLIACLEQQPHAKVVFGYWSRWFVDPRLRAYVEGLPPERKLKAPSFAWPLGTTPPPAD
jgi:4-amino-4-deoxy-L-arabinose transferase-like glycosyltransferase